jgi:mannose-6-phosphate isomerase-like protein (cupin superfamily)
MDPRFSQIFTDPENEIFKTVFFPDQVYHARYLNATTSPRYRYNVREVRSNQEVVALKGQVYQDGLLLTNFFRVEYRGSRLTEAARDRSRLLGDRVSAKISLLNADEIRQASTSAYLHWCPWVEAYQAEFWGTLETPLGAAHDVSVLSQMGRRGPITRAAEFALFLLDLAEISKVDLSFAELPTASLVAKTIADPVIDDNYGRKIQAPVTAEPGSDRNTIDIDSYRLDFRRGWFIPNARTVHPVRYRNAMMSGDHPDRSEDNIVEMRWLLQRELGSSLVFFHEVTVLPGGFEGAHRHIGSEELYYIFEGTGTAYMGDGDDPGTDYYEATDASVFGVGDARVRILPVQPGSVIYTKSGGIHGIRNCGTAPLRFVAFLYQCT